MVALLARCEYSCVESHSSRFAYHRKLTPFLSRNHALVSGNAGLSGLSRRSGLFGRSRLSGAGERERLDERDCANLNEELMAESRYTRAASECSVRWVCRGFRRGTEQYLIGQEKKPTELGRSIDFEVPAVEREDAPDLLTFCHGYQRGIRQVHR